jgi:hypothetical protein
MNTARAAMLALALSIAISPACTRVETPEPQKPAPVECDVELRSWVVAGRGRHLYLSCDCPDGFEHLEDRIEFTSIALRSDFDGALATDGLHRIARMTRGAHLGPVLGPPDDRLEATWRLDTETLACLQRDRAFTLEYRLLGPNSNSGIRAVAEACGLALPPHVLSGGGMLGQFPGIELSPGEEVPEDLWESVGIPRNRL